MWRSVLVLGYLTSTLGVPPCAAATTKSSASKRTHELTLRQFIEELKREGEPTQFHPKLIKLTGFPEGSTKRGFHLPVSETTDGASRFADIVFGKPEGADAPTAIGLYWGTTRKLDRSTEDYAYRTDLDGHLEKVVYLGAPLDENGKPVRGATKPTELDTASKEVLNRFQREVLDFWLKGTGRKKGSSKSLRQ